MINSLLIRSPDAPVVILSTSYKGVERRQLHCLRSLKDLQTIRRIDDDPAVSPLRHGAQLYVWTLRRLAFDEDDITDLDVCHRSSSVCIAWEQILRFRSRYGDMFRLWAQKA